MCLNNYRKIGLIGVCASVFSCVFLWITLGEYFYGNLTENYYYLGYAFSGIMMVVSIVISYVYSKFVMEKECTNETKISKEIFIVFLVIIILAMALSEKDVYEYLLRCQLVTGEDSISVMLATSTFFIISGTLGLYKRKTYFNVIFGIAIMFALMGVVVFLEHLGQ